MIGDYATAAAFRDALEQRLRSRSEQGKVPISFLRKRVVFERLLERLRETSESWVLKGALALAFRSKTGGRVTNDADLGVRTNVDEMREVMLRAAELDRGDGFRFRIEIVETRADAIRYRVHADLARRLFDTVRIDVVSSDPFIGAPQWVAVESFLEFAGFESLRIPLLPLEQHLAEKLHAYTRVYESGPSSRAKDLVDMALIARTHEIDGPALREAIVRTFERPDSHEIPSHLPAPPARWKVAYERVARGSPMETDLESGHEAARKLFDPVLADEAPIRWSQEMMRWIR